VPASVASAQLGTSPVELDESLEDESLEDESLEELPEDESLEDASLEDESLEELLESASVEEVPDDEESGSGSVVVGLVDDESGSIVVVGFVAGPADVGSPVGSPVSLDEVSSAGVVSSGQPASNSDAAACPNETREHQVGFFIVIRAP
jgi:hypothetical protein